MTRCRPHPACDTLSQLVSSWKWGCLTRTCSLRSAATGRNKQVTQHVASAPLIARHCRIPTACVPLSKATKQTCRCVCVVFTDSSACLNPCGCCELPPQYQGRTPCCPGSSCLPSSWLSTDPMSLLVAVDNARELSPFVAAAVASPAVADLLSSPSRKLMSLLLLLLLWVRDGFLSRSRAYV